MSYLSSEITVCSNSFIPLSCCFLYRSSLRPYLFLTLNLSLSLSQILPHKYSYTRKLELSSRHTGTAGDLAILPVTAGKELINRGRTHEEEVALSTDRTRTILMLQEELTVSAATANIAYLALETNLKVTNGLVPRKLGSV